jgi:LuxR family transcriptional regulator, maltose regulon positive regulatory protein
MASWKAGWVPAGQTFACPSVIVKAHAMQTLADRGIRGDVVLDEGPFPARALDGRAPLSQGGIIVRHRLFDRLNRAARVTQISAPAGSGKTVLVRSWLAESGRMDSAAWISAGGVTAQGGERDPADFCRLILDALRATVAGAKLIRPLDNEPGIDGRAIVERLIADLGGLEEPLWLVIDDVHHVRWPEVQARLRLLITCAPPEVRFLLVGRADAPLGLHRLRLEGELTEIRAADLRFTLEEARALFGAAGATLPEASLADLAARTEGWAAGLRLAARSVTGHPDPARFAEAFCGADRTVAEYLRTEVLDQLAEPARQLLLRTSVCERFSGELADRLSGGSGGEEVLRDLEEAGAFVTALDARRSWFRCHPLFADLLRRELRRSDPAGLAHLHGAAALWFADRGDPAEAVGHAQAAGDWNLAVRLLTEHFLSLVLDGRDALVREFLARFPAEMAAGPELGVLLAAAELDRASLGRAERLLAQAEQELPSVPADRRQRFQVNLSVMRLSLARHRGDHPAVVEEARRLLDGDWPINAAMSRQWREVRAVALISLGTAERWLGRIDDAERHLDEGTHLAHQAKRPWLELEALTQGAWVVSFRSFRRAAERFAQAIGLAGENGWAERSLTASAYAGLSTIRIWQMRLEEAELLLERAERATECEAEPATGVLLQRARGMLELARGRHPRALIAFQAAERLAGMLAAGYPDATPLRAQLLLTLVRMGETERAEQVMAGQQESSHAAMRAAIAALRLAQNNPRAAAAALAPVLAGSAPTGDSGWMTHVHLLEAITRDAVGDQAAAARALERALDVAESDGVSLSFVIQPAPRMLLRHARGGAAHSARIAEVLNLLGEPVSAPVPSGPGQPAERLTDSETRILRYLPTNLPAPEIADRLCLSVHTVRTHTRHLYEKLSVHSRTEAVEQARALGLLAPYAHARSCQPA